MAARQSEISVAEQGKRIPSATRPTVQAARRTVRAIAPKAKEIAYQSQPPRLRTTADAARPDVRRLVRKAFALSMD
jgi:hypothetical protein